MARTAAFTLAAIAATGVTAVPGHANPVSARVDVWLADWTGLVATICADGEVNDGTTSGTWLFTVTGARMDQVLSTPPPITHSGSALPVTCVEVNIGGPPPAVAIATLTFAGVGTSDVTGSAGLLYTWDPLTGGQEDSYSTSR
jgi:hypothetical protein